MSVMDEVNDLLDEAKSLLRIVNRKQRDELHILGLRWVEFFAEEFAHWGERAPDLAEPLGKRLEAERTWYDRLELLDLDMSYMDITMLINWRQAMNKQTIDVLLEHDLGAKLSAYEILEASEWRQQLYVRDYHRLHALFWFADAHRERMLTFAWMLDARAYDDALRAIHTIVDELKTYRDVTLPALLQFSQPHATSS
jgi:hypothetical protein